MKKSKYYLFFLIALPLLVISSITFFSCPPVEEEPVKNIIKRDGFLTLKMWTELLEEIYNNGVFVNLDLSECKMPDDGHVLKHANEDGSDYTETKNPYDNYYQFDPSFGGRFGKDFILSIILPDYATMISNASSNIYDLDTLDDIDENDKDNETNTFAFRHFTRLKSVTGKNIRLIGTFAFYNCKTLEEANFPNVIHVMQYAFYNCSSIKKFNYEKITDIMPSSFEGCSSLEKAEFINVRRICQRAFMNCTGLTEVNFPSAMEVLPEAFRNCKNLKLARFWVDPGTPPAGKPLDNWRKGEETPYAKESMAFHNNVFRGCTSLENLDVRKAWNVYFGAGALSDIGTSLTLWLYDNDGNPDENGKKCFGHPQVELLLGKRPVPETELSQDEKDMDIGKLTLKTLSIETPVVEPSFLKSQILYKDNEYRDPEEEIKKENDGFASIRNKINALYNPGERHKDFNEPKNPVVRVTVNGRPSASHPYDTDNKID